MSETKSLDFDKVLQNIGPLGKWQWIQSFWMLLVGICVGIGGVTFAFTAYEPNYRCIMPECNENISNTVYNTSESIKALTLLYPKVSIEEAGKQCYRFKSASCGNYSNNLPRERCPNSELVFDASVVSSSIVKDLDMVCDKAYQRPIFSSLYSVGMLIGAFVIGFASDTLGRRKALVLAISCLGISGVLIAFNTNKIIFVFLRILIGMGGNGSALVAFVSSAESGLPQHKVFLMFVPGMGFQVGEFIYAIAAYFIRDWIPLQLATCIPIVVMVLLYFVVPESCRWLISQGRTEEAKKILNNRAKINNFAGPIPDHIFQSDDEQSTKTNDRLTFGQSLGAIVKHKKLLLRSLNMILQWFCIFMGYWGSLYSSTTLSGNPHINFMLSMLAGAPGNLVYLFLPDKIGRKATLLTLELTLGVCCIGAGILMHFETFPWLQTGFSMLGRVAASACVKTCALFTAELFPTPIRNSAVGMGSFFGGLGAYVGFSLDILTSIWKPLPIFIFGACCSFTSILALYLPETKGTKLPETIEDVL